jgi:hypothetical protein
MSELKLKFVKGGNAKLDKKITTFSLPAGYTCPGAKDCLSRADRDTHTIIDGPHTKFRCFAASEEAVYNGARENRHHNRLALLECRTVEAMRALIVASLPPNTTVVRVHASGDFFNQNYFDAWMQVARACPDILFYAYTKSLPYWVARVDQIPENFVLTASYGGKWDHLIGEFNLRHAVVVFHPEDAAAKGLEIDHDDSHAYTKGEDSFALLLHGVQPKASSASDALKRMNKEKIQYAYSS